MPNEPEEPTYATREIQNVTKGHRGICTTCPTEEASITLEPGEIVEVDLTDLELAEAIATGWFREVARGSKAEASKAKGTTDHDNDGNMGGGPTPTPGDDVGAEHIRAAIMTLDPDNNDHWTQDGEPAVHAVSHMLGKQVSRAAIKDAAPDASRPKPD